MANPSPLHVLLAGLVLLALYSVPLFSTVLPPLFDYPNHLARFAVLAAGGNQFYEVRWAPLPNLAGDIMVPLLARAIPLAIAGKLFPVMIFALILGGTAWLNRIVSGKWRFWPLLAAAFLYNLQLRWGFLNYLARYRAMRRRAVAGARTGAHLAARRRIRRCRAALLFQPHLGIRGVRADRRRPRNAAGFCRVARRAMARAAAPRRDPSRAIRLAGRHRRGVLASGRTKPHRL